MSGALSSGSSFGLWARRLSYVLIPLVVALFVLDERLWADSGKSAVMHHGNAGPLGRHDPNDPMHKHGTHKHAADGAGDSQGTTEGEEEEEGEEQSDTTTKDGSDDTVSGEEEEEKDENEVEEVAEESSSATMAASPSRSSAATPSPTKSRVPSPPETKSPQVSPSTSASASPAPPSPSGTSAATSPPPAPPSSSPSGAPPSPSASGSISPPTAAAAPPAPSPAANSDGSSAGASSGNKLAHRHARAALWIRSFAGNEAWLSRVLLPSLRAFWPVERFGRVFVVLDKGSANDAAMAQRLLSEYGGDELAKDDGGQWSVSVARMPERTYGRDGKAAKRRLRGPVTDANDDSNATATAISSEGGGRVLFPQAARHHLNDPLLTISYAPNLAAGINGYHQQQLWTLYADQDVPATFPGGSIYTAHGSKTGGERSTVVGGEAIWEDGAEPDNDVIGIADSDAIIFTMPHEHTYFDEAGRPRVIPRVGLPIGPLWEQSANATEFMLGKPEPFRGMSYFPVYFYRRHFKELRGHVERLHGKPFIQVFLEMVGRGFYSQFNIMTAYAFHFHKDEYSWHYFLPDQDNGQPLNRTVLLTHDMPGVTHDWSFLDDAEATKPYPRTWAHWKHHRFKIAVKDHLIRGFCWSVGGDHDLCRANPMWNLAPVHNLAHLDMWDFEFATRGGQPVLDAQKAYYDTVLAELNGGKWASDALATWIGELSLQSPV